MPLKKLKTLTTRNRSCRRTCSHRPHGQPETSQKTRRTWNYCLVTCSCCHWSLRSFGCQMEGAAVILGLDSRHVVARCSLKCGRSRWLLPWKQRGLRELRIRERNGEIRNLQERVGFRGQPRAEREGWRRPWFSRKSWSTILFAKLSTPNYVLYI